MNARTTKRTTRLDKASRTGRNEDVHYVEQQAIFTTMKGCR